MSEATRCNAPHPDNGNPGALFRDRHGQMHDSRTGDMACDLEKGHPGPHHLFRKYNGLVGMGEIQQWGGDMEPGEWVVQPVYNTVIDLEASMHSTGTSSIYKLEDWPA